MASDENDTNYWKMSVSKVEVNPQENGPSRRSIRSSMLSRDKAYIVRDNQTRMFQGLATRSKRKFTKWQLFNIVNRLVVIAAACQYIYISMLATWRTVEVLRSMPNPTQVFGVFTASLIADYTGDGLIRDSPLIPLFNAEIYNYAFLTHMYTQMVNDTSYNTTVLTDLELVVVVVDCSSTQLNNGDPSIVRVFNVARSRDDPTDVYIVMISLSVQDYQMWSYKKAGPALVGMIAIIHDMQGDITKQIYMMAPTYPYQRSLDFEIYEFIKITEESYRELRSIPKDPTTQSVKHLVTSRKHGFFDGDVQSNIHSMYSHLDVTDARSALYEWEWLGEALIEDSWAWVHGLHFIFGMQTFFSLLVLFLVTYQNIRAGKIWVGAPFASTSTATFVTRGILVVVSWYVNSFWTLFEFALSNAAILSGAEGVYVHKELVHADVLVVYLGVVAFLSWMIHERIDPSVAIFLFEIIHSHRLSFIRISPSVLNEIVTYSNSVFRLGDAAKTPVVAAMAPLDFWSAFQIPKKDATFLAASFFPKISLLAIVICYALLRKLYRYFYPEDIHQRSTRSADQSANEKAAIAQKGNLTNFEISTGAELQTRFGIISDYKNYAYFKGMKFASADGVYCSGYVIVNGKFLVSSKHLMAVVMMKLVRTRFTNVYAYEVEGNSVKDTARLVYPETFTWSDLWHLNVNVLL
ncbi:hypothetical protein PF005_g6215 [Phytophthora fragariae]|uniref:Transmembrane protein n=2 Tax=Phytophthora fragariae TaxID=53985 RepID=A0A6A4A393_9STRA|nr:hypothetical protein PF003_g12359 [Phytophthora fragariae]KAE8943378.1 hypothetical protein PF009_g6885 [Phytophthora fragariae]KAE9125431.1 hypothetical protein PF007_g6351 [Phytophthora fragariae]KAE9125549.1 hypothetical protein PF010_g5584 [Phytophthora fragariae]KAE9150044.1 hypothetical protein PF006_g5537 [Phytophthora fragariae]